jgi:hypothetical protein
MNKGVTQRQAFDALLKGKKIRSKQWEPECWVAYVRTGDESGLHYRVDLTKLAGESLPQDVLFTLILFDNWEIVDA